MKISDYEWVKHGRRREQFLLAFDKPRMPAELRMILGLKSNAKLSTMVKGFLSRGLIKKIAPGLYGLTRSGERLRCRLAREKGIQCTYTRPRLDWRTYVWVIIGRQRKALLRALDRQPRIVAELVRIATGYYDRLRQVPIIKRYCQKLSRTDAYMILRQFVERGLATAEKHDRHVMGAITRKGEAIKRQMLLCWLMIFGFL